MTTGHSSGFVLHANLILFIRDDETRDLIEITFGLKDFRFGSLNHFVGREKLIVLDFDTSVVNFGGNWVQTFGDVIVYVLFKLVTSESV
jgi:hypothetical protein